MYYIYGIRNTRSDEIVYVGYTRDLASRQRKHFAPSTWEARSTHPLYQLFLDEGRNHFKLEVIEEVRDLDAARRAEYLLIKELSPVCNQEKGHPWVDVYRTNREFVGTFKTTAEIRESLQVDHRNVHACLNGIRMSDSGYCFFHHGEAPPDDYFNQSFGRGSVGGWNRKQVRGVNQLTGEETVYESAKHASQSTGVSASNIRSAAAGNRKSAGGYTWAYLQ